MTDYCQTPITHDGGIVICEAPATGMAHHDERPYPACDDHKADNPPTPEPPAPAPHPAVRARAAISETSDA